MTCVVCGQPYKVRENTELSKPPRACSRECGAILRKLNNNGLSPGHTPRAIEKRIHSQKVEKTCELCGKTFQGTANSKYCSELHYKPCPVCGKDVRVERGHESEPPKCCSKDCSIALRKRTCQTRYGVSVSSQSDYVRDKLRNIANDPAVVSKRVSTNILNWGTDNPSKNPEVRNKISDSIRSEACRDRTRLTNESKYGVEFAMQSPEIAKKYSNTILSKYGVPYYCMTDDCKSAQGNIISSVNRYIGRKLSDLGLRYEFEYKIDAMSYDIHIVDTNILLEIDPTYTHNAIGNHWNSRGISSDYHLTKTQLAAENGYRCIHIFDWDNPDKVLSLLKSKQVVYGRHCEVVVLSQSDVAPFLTSYHLQGTCRGQEVCLGLLYDDMLVEVMTFGKPRYNKNYKWELLRLCTHTDFQIVGGANRLYRYFLRNYSPTSILSYCDKSKFVGKVYENLGFNYIRDTEPQKVWSKGSKKITDNLLRQRGYDQLFGTSYGKGASNNELMIQNGWLPVYDCGQATYAHDV